MGGFVPKSTCKLSYKMLSFYFRFRIVWELQVASLQSDEFFHENISKAVQ